MIPGWPYSVVAALEPGRTSWTLPLEPGVPEVEELRLADVELVHFLHLGLQLRRRLRLLAS